MGQDAGTEPRKPPFDEGTDAGARADRELICLGDRLERATRLKCQAHQARNVLSMAALTAGSGFAVALMVAGKAWSGVGTLALFAICAVAVFHIYARQATIWRRIAAQLQGDQHAIATEGSSSRELRTAE